LDDAETCCEHFGQNKKTHGQTPKEAALKFNHIPLVNKQTALLGGGEHLRSSPMKVKALTLAAIAFSIGYVSEVNLSSIPSGAPVSFQLSEANAQTASQNAARRTSRRTSRRVNRRHEAAENANENN
jgi:hypothetical protein